MQLEQVQRYVLSSLLCSVVLLHSLAMAGLGATVADKGGARQGLFVISLLLGVLAVTAVRLINKRSVLTWWLLTAVPIPVVIYYFAYWR